MGFLDRVFSPAAASPYREDDDFWFKPLPGAGLPATPDTAMRLSAVQAAVRILAGVCSNIPLHLYRRIANGGRVRADREPLERVLNHAPNPWQTAKEFRRDMTKSYLLRGNAYAQVLPGPSGAVEMLVPLHPDSVRPERVAPTRIVYHVRDDKGRTVVLGRDDVLHLRDMTDDGVVGLSRIQQAALGVGVSLAALKHSDAFFRNGARPGGVLTTDQILNKDQREANLKAWNDAHGGVDRWGGTALLDKGAKFEALTISNGDAQLLEIMGFGVEDIARLYQIPPHLIGMTEKQTSWGTGVEQMTIGFLQFSALEHLVIWETAIARDLIVEPDVYFVEHMVDALLRADHKTRRETYRISIESGQMTPNEARRKENEPPRADGFGDRPWMPTNFRFGDEPTPTVETSPAPNQPAKPNGQSGAIHVEGVQA